MSTAVTIIRPEDHGRKMTLDEFEFAEAAEGSLFELSQGVITMIDVPKRKHLLQVHAIREQFYKYSEVHSERINTIAAGGECKILVENLESERHPDIAIYKTAPPNDVEESEIWAS
jgi:hypothetical protein